MSQERVRALIVGIDGIARLEIITPDLETFNEIVEGPIQILTPSGGDPRRPIGVSGWHAYLNEEGKMAGQMPNRKATDLAAAAGWRGWVDWHDMLVGPVVFLGTGSPDPAGEGSVPSGLLWLAQHAVDFKGWVISEEAAAWDTPREFATEGE